MLQASLKRLIDRGDWEAAEKNIEDDSADPTQVVEQSQAQAARLACLLSFQEESFAASVSDPTNFILWSCLVPGSDRKVKTLLVGDRASNHLWVEQIDRCTHLTYAMFINSYSTTTILFCFLFYVLCLFVFLINAAR